MFSLLHELNVLLLGDEVGLVGSGNNTDYALIDDGCFVGVTSNALSAYKKSAPEKPLEDTI